MTLRQCLTAITSLVAIIAGGPVFETAAMAQEIAVQDLQGATLAIVVKYRGTFARDRGPGPGNITHTYRIKIGPEENVQVSLKRDVQAITPVGIKQSSLNRNFSGKIGTPKQEQSGSFLWLLDKNELVLLRTLEVGGFKLAVTFTKSDKGLTCKAAAPYLKESGAGAGKTNSAFGGNVRIISMQQVASTCSVGKS